MSPAPVASSSRRKSVAVPSASSADRPVHKRRAHSVTAAEIVLSPRSRARRSAPRKSILKMAVSLDESTISSSRRVSFAPAIDVRLFEKDEHEPKRRKSRRPSAADLEDEDEVEAMELDETTAAAAADARTDENAGASAVGARRKSAMRAPRVSEYGDMSMDVDASPYVPAPARRASQAPDSSPLPAGFDLGSSPEKGLLLDEDGDGFDAEDMDEEGEDMDVTRQMARRSLAVPRFSEIGGDEEEEEGEMELTQGARTGRRRSSLMPQSAGVDEEDEEYDDPLGPIDEDGELLDDEDPLPGDDGQFEEPGEGEDDTEGPQPVHVEYSAPLEQPLSRPRRPSQAVLDLAAVTHSGAIASAAEQEPPAGGYAEDMDLGEAQSRLARYRESLGLGLGDGDLSRIAEEDGDADSFGDDSLGLGDGDGDGDGDQTVNLTQIMARARQSVGGDGRPSGGSEMELTSWRRDETVEASPEDRAPAQQDAPPSSPTPPPKSASTSSFAASAARRRSSVALAGLSASIAAATARLPTFDGATPVFAPPPPPASAPTPAPAPAPPSPQKPSRLPVPTSPRKPGTSVFAPAPAQQANKAYPSLAELEEPAPPGKGQAFRSLSQSTAGPSSSTARPAPAPQKRASMSAVQRTPDMFGPRAGTGVFTAPGASRAPLFASQNAGPAGSKGKEREGEPMAQDDGARTSPSGYIRGSPVRVMRPSVGLSQDALPAAGLSKSTLASRRLSTSAGASRVEEFLADAEHAMPDDDDDFPPISIEQFMQLTEIDFMKDIFVPPVLRKSLAPRGSSSAAADVPPADFFVAQYEHVPQYALYTKVIEDMERWSAHAAETFAQAEADAQRVQPSLFREYVEADEDIQRDLVQQLKVYQRFCRAKVKLQWRQWRLDWTQELSAKADEGFAKLTEDAEKLEKINKEAQALLPTLREHVDQLDEELRQEQAITEEIQADDQEYLEELKGTIDEQEAVLQSYREEEAESLAAIQELEQRIAEIDISNKALVDRTNHLKGLDAPEETLEELRDQLAQLEYLTPIRMTRVKANRWGVLFMDKFLVEVPAVEFMPLLSQLSITLAPDAQRKRDLFPALTQLELAAAPMQLARAAAGREREFKMARVVETLGDFWTACAEIRRELSLLDIQWPMEAAMEQAPGEPLPGLRTSSQVVLPTVAGRVDVEFVFSSEVFLRWPFSAGKVVCSVKRGYGTGYDHNRIQADITESIAAVTRDNTHRYLVNAVLGAVEEFYRK